MENQRELTVLLIEDDQFACEEIRNYIDQLDDMHLLGITDDSNKALDMVQYCIPDAIILDLELHEGGGNGLFFLSKLHDLGLEKLPYILITTQNTSNVTLEAARQLGADFIITKYERDYFSSKTSRIIAYDAECHPKTFHTRHNRSHTLSCRAESQAYHPYSS